MVKFFQLTTLVLVLLSGGTRAFAFSGDDLLVRVCPASATNWTRYELLVTGLGTGAYPQVRTSGYFNAAHSGYHQFPEAESYQLTANVYGTGVTIISSTTATISDTNRVDLAGHIQTATVSTIAIQPTSRAYSIETIGFGLLGVILYGLVFRPGLWRMIGL